MCTVTSSLSAAHRSGLRSFSDVESSASGFHQRPLVEVTIKARSLLEMWTALRHVINQEQAKEARNMHTLLRMVTNVKDSYSG
jgi:hypothetical protein